MKKDIVCEGTGYTVVYREERYSFTCCLFYNPIGSETLPHTVAQIAIDEKVGGPNLLTLKELKALQGAVDRLLRAWMAREIDDKEE